MKHQQDHLKTTSKIQTTRCGTKNPPTTKDSSRQKANTWTKTSKHTQPIQFQLTVLTPLLRLKYEPKKHISSVPLNRCNSHNHKSTSTHIQASNTDNHFTLFTIILQCQLRDAEILWIGRESPRVSSRQRQILHSLQKARFLGNYRPRTQVK